MCLIATNKLRVFTDLDDLFDNNTDESILSWVNELSKLKLKRAESQQKRNAYNRALEQALEARLLSAAIPPRSGVARTHTYIDPILDDPRREPELLASVVGAV